MTHARAVPETGATTLPLRVDQVAGGVDDPTRTLHCTDIEGTELRVRVRGSPPAGLSLETGNWYQFNGITRSGAGAELLYGETGTTERIDPPDRQPQPPRSELDEPWLVQLGASNGLVAVTVQPRPTEEATAVSATDPESFEIGAVCLASPGESGEPTVYHREEPDVEDERLLLQHVVGDIAAAEGATLVTGDRDAALELLYTRLAVAAGGDVIESGAQQVLGRCYHADLRGLTARLGVDSLADAAGQFGIDSNPVRLDDYDTGVDPAEWRDTSAAGGVSDPRMTDRDYAVLVERHLADEAVEPAALSRCLKTYAGAALPLLCELAGHGGVDRLGCPRLAGRLPPGPG